MTGLTAYFGLLEVGEPKAGQTIVVSGAAGAVGSMVGQIGKLKACHVVGIAGGAEKCRYLIEELGFDAAIDYKAEPDLAAALQRECPNGIDVYFDNVGGPTLDAVLAQINFRARVVLCGAISQYNSDKCRARRTIWRCSATARAWKASSCSITPLAMPRRRSSWRSGWPTASSNPASMWWKVWIPSPRP